jgi:hypothetical protein
MTINAADFRRFVIAPALAALAPAGIPVTKTAADLLMATAAMESDLGTWLHQEAGGPALGVFEEDPDQLGDLEQLLTTAQKAALATVATPQPLADQLGANLIAAAAVCRLHYWHATTEPLPADTIAGLWGYYKQFYNSELGAATMPEFIDALKLTDLALAAG